MKFSTYSYGAREPTNKPIVEEQLSLAHKYYNTLVEIELGGLVFMTL